MVEGGNLDSKAIVGAAYGYLPGGQALTAKDFSGELADAAGKLMKLGYEVSSPGQNADWSWDEHVLALDFYLTHRNPVPVSRALKSEDSPSC